ncbi:CrcB family protein [Antarcticibacterium flavum]|uniref:Fluoride-specific ion channel FluC n=1 Tax=Antarcticibacterium flavum TaxID=2058175 RepID=A0A5B7WZR9_9FLAO|nr:MULTISPECIES: CrcB family protein [Antarcticibacterium]MCM4160739.1 fluoride efflux transporter CrcB [Antarcticibacterium sp. W02-3]QCY68784.1 CrcB family protein [Antarcticibacterium flavum]
MKALLLVFIGGGLGSMLRFGVYKLLQLFSLASFYGTLTVNVLGSLILGALMGYLLKESYVSSNLFLFLATGFCGGFTTFSTFAFENQDFLRTGDYFHFLVYTGGSIVLGILAIVIGLYLSKLL